MSTAPSNGFILWRGPSVYDTTPIVVIVTGLRSRSRNEKTGDLLQSYILPDLDLSPVEACQTGADAAVCGDCGVRPVNHDTCYVNVGRGPLQVWRALRAGRYQRYNPVRHNPYLRGRMLRLGSYGDPALTPLAPWRKLFPLVASTLGYTHQWRTCHRDWSRYLMASCDTTAERACALSLGWRTFRVRATVDSPVSPGEFICPASAEAGKRLTCAQCGACDGAHSPIDTRASPVIAFHGTTIPHMALAAQSRFADLQRERTTTVLALPLLGGRS